MEHTESRQIILSVLGIAVLIIAFVGVSYAAFHTILGQSSENGISTGTISLVFEDDTEAISINNAMPVADSYGKEMNGSGNVYDFSIRSILSKGTTLNYEISAEKLPIDGVTLNDADIRIYLQKEENGHYIDTPITMTPQAFKPLTEDSFLGSQAGDMVLYSGTLSNFSNCDEELAEKFRLRIWVSKDTIIDSISRQFNIKLNVTAKAI